MHNGCSVMCFQVSNTSCRVALVVPKWLLYLTPVAENAVFLQNGAFLSSGLYSYQPGNEFGWF